jgi:hypothetical protein
MALTIVGCAPTAPKLVPVAGRITVAGQPVPLGSVQFRADPARGNHSMEVPVSAIRPDGGYDLETGGQRGAPLGWWRVLVIADNFRADNPPPSPVWPKFPPGYQPPRPLVHERYLRFHDTDLSVEVVENPEEGAYELTLKP